MTKTKHHPSYYSNIKSSKKQKLKPVKTVSESKQISIKNMNTGRWREKSCFQPPQEIKGPYNVGKGPPSAYFREIKTPQGVA